jgi:hypothetical protein
LTVCVALCATAVTAPTVASAALSSAAGGAAEPSVTFHLPRQAQPGARIVARGRVGGLEDRASLQGQLSVGGRWKTLGRRTVASGGFRLPLSLPKSGAAARLRALVVIGGRRVAISPTARVELARPARPRPPVTTPGTVPADTAAAPAAPPSPPATPVEPLESVYWGGYIDPGDPSQPSPINKAAIDKFEAAAKKPPSLLESFSAFATCAGCKFIPFPASQLEAIRNRGAVPFFTWASEATSGERHQPNFQLADIIAGNYDSEILAWATEAKAWGRPFFLRFDWEMNGNWYPWSVGTVPVGSGKTTAEKEEEGKIANGNVKGEYVEAWQHVHDIFTAVGATNATWVWCPYINPNANPNLASLEGLYPGDGYVDWTCLDGYNYGTSEPTTKWRTFSYLFGPQYAEITTAIAPTRPMLIAEVASSESGGSKAAWIAEMFAALPTSFPVVRGLMWFDYFYDNHDWWLQSSTAAQEAFAAGVADPRYPADVFGGLATSPIPAL